MAELNLFLSWSGKLSHAVAEYFNEWIPKVLPGFKPWISSKDIKSGKPWFSSITDQIGKSPACIIFVTKENAKSTWLHYEAGGIQMAENAFVCPYLINLSPSDVGSSPLAQLQMCKFEKDETWKLIRDLNTRLESPHEPSLLKAKFDSRWPSLNKKIEKLVDEFQVVEEDEPEQQSESISLSPQAQEILLAAANGDGTITVFTTFEGYELEAGEISIIDDQSPRNVASYKSALRFLEEHRLIEDVGKNVGEIFEVTEAGFVIADALRNKLKNEQQPDAE